ncbi:exodeoxyribonuclease V subunit gamma [Mycolicibacter minnesotensis]|uniref:RecBCD enzyme subunit RecC n=1 Tax=Mycolicibacter minnesotensis TaxID=1118379 RepID=A0A7I7R6G2_9MYCO|nr:exodeoxyribonuclease V subunit gamma [Mycolicibacter minnesotensis]ORB04018.1 exodeoxyribonuclease V subunit gamma [Mycolicibacter minnesotensis]BBY34254.1 RecBCD enzyme subunit RecC [Mycolicibacter minnesotensis]
MGLHLHRAERTDTLVDGLGALLATPPADPFDIELVLVPARGVERWLSQRLSHVLGAGPAGDGVCAGVEFRSPGSLIAEVTGAGDDDPWSPDALAWPLLAVIDASLDAPWCATLARHVGHADPSPEGELRRGRRYAVARRLAGLFASYARQRPQLLIDWSNGESTDGAGGVLHDDLGWQPPLWRALVAAVGIDPPNVRHRDTVARLRQAPVETLPTRLSLFGHTRLACTDIELLQALATHHDLHLWLPHASDALWQALHGVHGPVPRVDDETRHRARHPVLETLGRDLRELQRGLPAAPDSDEYLRAPTRPDTLLGWLQSDLGVNALRPEGRSFSASDRSVQVHSCHSPARQVDVLREVLLGLLQDDPTLEPRDIVVMCPDIEAYAPLIVADFGLGELAGDTHPAHRLRVQLADRALTQTNPLLAVAAELLEIAGSRATATAVLNLAHTDPVRARFGFTDNDLSQITTWVRTANIRWGFDPHTREPYGLSHIVHNTWRFGLDRILTGVAMSDDSQAWLDTALPLDDVGSSQVELAGKLAEFVARLQATVDRLDGTRPLAEWITVLRDGVAELADAGTEAWQSAHLQRELTQVLEHAADRSDTALRLPDVRILMAGHLAGRPNRANFRTGTLTVCTMVPMRSVPHRVVCLLGVDDGVFPRLDLPDGDDVLARRPMTGERDIRSEDRQLLLDAITAATDKLVITYTGADEHSGHPRPPAVPLAELIDALDQTTPEPVREHLVVEHPLQPFDVKNVEPGRLIPDVPFTFDPTVPLAARTAAGTRRDAQRFITEPLAAPPLGDVALIDLLKFFKDPVKGFFSALNYTLPWEVDEVEDGMPVEIDALGEWAVGNRMLHDMLRGTDPANAIAAEWRRGSLPPGQLGWRTAKQIRDRVVHLAAAALEHRHGPPVTYDIDLDLGGGRRLTGTVTPVFDTATVSVNYSKLRDTHLLQAWIPLVVLAAQRPDVEWTARCIGRARDGERALQRVLGAPPNPAQTLRELLWLYDIGRCEPLPLPIKTSFAWAEKRHAGRDPVGYASSKWATQRYPGEDAEPASVRVWGPRAPFDVLQVPPRPGEEIDGEDTRLGALAARLWLPLLRAERRGR